MRPLLHIGLFALALTTVTQASADDDRDHRRHKKVVVSYDDAPRQVRTVRASHDPSRAVYDSRRVIHDSPRAIHVARRDYADQREDLEQITRIAARWDRATANRNRDAQWKVNRRIDAWLSEEIRESAAEPDAHRYSQKVRALRHELTRLEQRRRFDRSFQSRGHHGSGRYGSDRYRGSRYERGQYIRNQRGYFAAKAQILDELVTLSERQLRRAEARLQRPHRVSYVYR